MNPGALVLMFGVGAVGLILSTMPIDNKPRWCLWAGIAWSIFWCGPALVSLWIVGVFG